MPSDSTTLLIVDGYNVIGAWPQLQPFMRRDELHIARRQLLETLTSFVTYRGYSGLVVFDAHRQAMPSIPEAAPTGLEIYYTAYAETADTAIERTCAQLQWEDCRVRVATSDRLVQLVAGGFDADWISAQGLLEEVKTAARQVKQTIRTAPKPQRGISGYLDRSTRDRLMQWRLNGTDGV
jgi:predicted RNA-binding protein with PIN domain